ncbi:two-component system, sensor histidine kinase RegB [Rhodoblastus acidophilus]|uniref:histidine kinase n=1 Tax=Rhodoblastus acidophilus TaxID=1074 RepID=A0A212RLC6_RHOAC|nr:ActS/PrrB/RegB family redox-sensitive histidine kinase [Rhodoblastus acidophilus]MCW2315837.1 two-component system sensor histidine kinase RegB [Rhodoblastus acidophilus]PPQ39083.1 sensor histidine kinase [Rhodoblastus acidophilus]RAI24208.1 sensor histidine kinase [Rhodoblastus acidophilus]SNB73260.1 two-component system, sensor histidine kinase RegB [Rhodoblastus acidophilus]
MQLPSDGVQFGQNARHIRMDTLVKLRWLAVAGQAATILVTAFVLGFSLDVTACLSLVGVLAAANLLATLFAPRHLRLSEFSAAGFLIFDVIQLSALLYVTGGLENPFAILILAPVTISAVSLRFKHIISVVLASAICVTLLCLAHRPLPWHGGVSFSLPQLYQDGLWAAIIVSSLFISVYVSRVANEYRTLSQALAAAELVLERENHLSRLDGLAAAAAHELGTPLATISLVTHELKRADVPQEIKEDLGLLEQEARRCRDILGKLTSLEEDDNEPFTRTKLSLLLEQIASPYQQGAAAIKIALAGEGDEPRSDCSPTVIYGIGNFIDNATDFARAAVTIDASWDHEKVKIAITDDGPGFPVDLIDQLGEPYLVRSSARGGNIKDRAGLGLGVFIAKTLLERSGASVSFSNARNGGARVALEWSRARFEQPSV